MHLRDSQGVGTVLIESTDRFVGVALEEVASGLQFPEGPVVLPNGDVLLVEIARGTLSRVSPDGAVSVVAELGGGPNGAAIGPDGAVYITNNGGCFEFIDLGGFLLPGPTPPTWRQGSIQRVDLATGEFTTLYDSFDGNPLRAPNDLVFDDDGGMWFTDHGVRLGRSSDITGLYYAAADGSAIREVVFGLESPNGIALSPDGSRLYAAETHSGRVFEWEVTGPGSLSAASHLNAGGALLYGAAGGALFDSMAVDGDGSVCVATLVTGGISVISPNGAHTPDGGVEFLATGDPLTTNICFASGGSNTAFITLSGSGRLVRCEWPSAGLDLAFGAGE